MNIIIFLEYQKASYIESLIAPVGKVKNALTVRKSFVGFSNWLVKSISTGISDRVKKVIFDSGLPSNITLCFEFQIVLWKTGISKQNSRTL